MFIENAYLFQGMSPEFLEQISQSLIEESYPEGDFLFRQGEPAGFLYVLQEGRVRLTVGERGQVAHTVSNPGEAFGWSSLVERPGYTASAKCVAPTRVIKIGRQNLNRIFERDPASGLMFFRRLARVISQRLVDTYKMLPSAHAGPWPASPGF
jgi:CRP-like cAMP-binding protein